MKYSEFESIIMQYDSLYQQGLKKQANEYIVNALKEIDVLDETEKGSVFHSFVRILCDSDKYNFLKARGNGRIPYAIEQSIKTWLLNRCMLGKMPEMRWFYELFRYDILLSEQAVQFLNRAYEHSECDKKTAELLFCLNLNTLCFGAHHFPDGCVITDEDRNSAFKECEKILNEKSVDAKLQEQLKYYEVLYACYDRYSNDGKARDFYLYCKDAGIENPERKN